MSPVLDGVRIGPLDPDRGETFGQVGGQSAARRLVRHHTSMNPPALLRALRRVRQDARSEAVDREEAEGFIRDVYEAAGEELPEDSIITGYAVRGEDEQPELQALTFTFTTKSGRTGKGFVPYGADELSTSRERGDRAAQIAKLKEAGLPIPEALAAVTQAITGEDPAAPATDEAAQARIVELDEENDKLADENNDLKDELDELRQRLAALEAAPPRTSDAGVETGPQNADGATDGPVEVPEPYEGYEGKPAQDVRQRIREANDPDLARRVLAYETRQDGANRSTVVSAAQEVLDRSSS